MAFAGTRKLRLIHDVGIKLARRLPKQAQRPLATPVIPDTSGNDTVPPRDARHVGQAGNRVCHEVDDQLREGGVERPIRKREVLRGPLQHLDAGEACPRGRDKRLGRVDGRHGGGPQPCDQLGRQCARAAADIDDPLARLHATVPAGWETR